MRVTCVLANTYCLKKAIPSKRQARQMEKRYGPAWRYIVKTCSLHGISGSEGTRADRCELVHGTAIGCSDSKPVYSRTCELNPVSAAGDIKISTNALQQAMEAGCFTSEENTPLGGTAHPDGAGQRDPLLEFMERNEEDAALMLAMWTSLRRCCLHATELSESLSRSARWFLHYLIQVRAVAAALRFYERLLCLGVQLQKWDVLLLIRSLPYEHCIANTDVQSTSWPKEHERLPWTERRLMKLRQSGRLRAGEGHGAAASPQPAKNGVECSLQGQKTAAAAPLRSNGCPPNVGTDAGSTTTVSQVVAADHVQRFVTPFPRCGQSGWVKRWLLYEASMGNIDVVDGKFVVSSQCFPDSDCLPMDDTGCNHSTASSVKDGETMVDVTTLLKHLMLLQDTSDAVFQRHNSAADNKLAKRGSVTKASRYHTPKSQHRHWPEALQVARMFLDFRSAVVGLNNRNGAQLKGCRLASGEFIDTLQRAVLASNSWKVTLRCLRAAEGYNISFDSSTLTKLFVMMAKAEPWLVSRTVERCTAHYILPKLSSETSVGYAARALWFTHVSSVKATREDDYLDLIGSSSMNLSACIKQAKVYIILSSSLLRVEFDRFRADTITQRAMAASARLGLHPQDRGALLPTTSGDCSRNNLHGSGHTGEHALTLPENLQRAFELLCVAVPRVVRLLSCTAVSQEDVASLSTMLFDVVCGDRGLCGLFGDLYTVKKVNWSTKEVKVAVAMASCVLKIIDVLCFTEQHCKPKDCGAGFMSVRQLLHLLTVATEVVETIPSHIARSVAIQECMLPLIRISSRLPKCVFCFLNVNTQNEKLLFGCFSETTPEAVSLTVRILLLLVRTDLVQRIFPLRTRLLVAAMLQPDNPLGMQVRRYIPQRHQKRLDMILYRRRKGGGIGGTLRFSTDHMAPLPRRWVAHTPEDIARIEATARMRSSVYSVALRYCNDKAEMERVLKSHTYQMEWEDALLMLSVSLFHLRLPPASFTVSFFAVVLSRLSTAAALPSSLWLQAASVYWAAVDHTSRAFVTNERNDTSPISSYHLHERVVFSQLLLPLLLVCKKSNMHDTGWGWLKCWAPRSQLRSVTLNMLFCTCVHALRCKTEVLYMRV
ncbi:hypothetical protein ERJ75_000964300 [Trypanosoma vivax]|nr:hypothetical protein ERJ75_000964300 [Trypanosoma vivax]